MPTVAVRNLVVGYGHAPVASVDAVTLGADRVTLVVGPNGSGKTTLLKTIAGLLPALGGEIAPRPRCGSGGAVFVHSAAYLFSGTVARNMRLASRRHDEVARTLAALGVEDLWTEPVAKLSTGQRQRVALARALATSPALLLVDEPEGGMDTDAIGRWRDVLTRAVAAGRPAIVVAAHRPAALEGMPVQVVTLRPAGADGLAPFAGSVGRL